MNAFAFYPVSALNTGTAVNASRAHGEFAQAGQVAYVMRRVGAKSQIVLTSFGSMDRMEIGKATELIADQTGRSMGRYILEGIARFEATDGQNILVLSDGQVPDRKLRHYVVK